MNVKLLCVISLFFIVSLLPGCGGGADGGPSEQTGIVSGYVVSAVGDTPVVGATVKAGSTEITTAEDGSYLLKTAIGERIVVHIDAENFAENFSVTTITQGKTSTLRTKLLPIGVSIPVNIATGGTVTVPASTAQVTLPAGGLLPIDGGAPAVSVNVAVTPINPATDPSFMPGDYTALAVGGEELVAIESFGAMLVDIRDDSGMRYSLAEGATAVIRIPLGTRSTNPPATIPLFYFNETTGLWVEEGAATLAGIAPDQYYEGSVSHFSYWNADRVMETIYVSGCVQDVNGDPVPNIYIISDGSNYSGQGYGRNASDGSFRIAIRSDSMATIIGADQNWQAITNEVSVGPYQSDISMMSCLIVTPPPLVVATTSLPNGAVDMGYGATLAGSGGYPPYQWSVVEQQLPTGLELNAATGEIAGTPTIDGNSSFTVQLQDSDNPPNSVNTSLDIIIDWLSARTITSFSLAGIAGEINEATGAIMVTVPHGTDVTGLVAQFETTGAGTSVKVGATLQISEVTANNFSNPVLYTVTAVDGTPAYYTVTVAVVVTPATWSVVSAGSLHTMAIKSDGTLWAWGSNTYNQLGEEAVQFRRTPTKIGAKNNWLTVSAGDQYTMAIQSDGTLWAWGRNMYGRLGDGTTTNRTTPTKIGNSSDWLSVSTGGYHTVAIQLDGTLWAWGHNGVGQLGDGTMTGKRIPIQIGMDNDWLMVSTGVAHSVALKSDGTLWGWGSNSYGQLGFGRVIRRTTPTQIGTEVDWSVVSVGSFHTVATKSDNTLWSWGLNSSGQIGNGTVIDITTPMQIGINGSWSVASAGGRHTVAIQQNGSLWAWGRNEHAALGDGSTRDSATPIKIGIASNWMLLSAGSASNHTMAIQSDGTLWAWGFNVSGLLGTNTGLGLRRTPTNVP